MSRRKREITGLANERDFPHLVELALPPVGFRSVFLDFDAFCRERRVPVRRGRSRHEGEQSYIRFCFPDTATADAFRDRFGGVRLTSHRKSQGRGPRRPRRLEPRDLWRRGPMANRSPYEVTVQLILAVVVVVIILMCIRMVGWLMP
jgi:hypothetical protein